MLFEVLKVGPLEVNCYLVGSPDTRQALVVDPGAEGDRILTRVAQLGLKVEGIVLTHGHFDHIGAAAAVRKATGAPVMIHPADASMLSDPKLNFSHYVGEPIALDPPEMSLQEEVPVRVGAVVLGVLHTPGHTPGGVCLHVRPPAGSGEDFLLTGDTLFAGSVGRTDTTGGSWEQLIDSITRKLVPFAPRTPVQPGHGPATTIGDELAYNPFLAGLRRS